VTAKSVLSINVGMRAWRPKNRKHCYVRVPYVYCPWNFEFTNYCPISLSSVALRFGINLFNTAIVKNPDPEHTKYVATAIYTTVLCEILGSCLTANVTVHVYMRADGKNIVSQEVST